MADSNGNGPKLFLGGVLLGLGVAEAWRRSTTKTSRMEKEEPELVSEVMEHLEDLLDDLELDEEVETEEDFQRALFDYFEDHCEYPFESCPHTDFGRPDFLIDGVVALELKVNPGKNERDRLIGQVLGYSRQWPTWILLVDTPQSQVQKIENLLKDHKLDHIPVISFS